MVTLSYFIPKNNRSFALTELLLVMGIMGILLTLGTVSLFNLQRRTYLDSMVTTLVSDLRHEQLKSMLGYTAGENDTASYGIRFESNRYILFRGNNYTPNDPHNFIVNLDGNIEITAVTLPDSQIIFEKGSGLIRNYLADSSSITLKSITSSEQKTIWLNKYGVIIAVN